MDRVPAPPSLQYSVMSVDDDDEAEQLFQELIAEINNASFQGVPIPPAIEPLTFIDLVRKLIEKDVELKNRLAKMVEELETHKLNANIAKTTGTSVAGLGLGISVVGLIAAPFTLGLSTLAVIGGGVTSVLGGLTTSGTVITESFITKSYENELKTLEEERNVVIKIFKDAMIVINLVIHKLVQLGNDRNVVIAQVFLDIKSGSFDPTKKDNIEEVVNRYVVESEEHFDAMKSDFLQKSDANLNLTLGIVGTSMSVCRIAAMSITPFLDDVAGIFFKSSRFVGAATGAVLGGVFVGLDIYNLVQSWKNDHQLAPHLKETISKLEDSEKEWVKVLSLYENL